MALKEFMESFDTYKLQKKQTISPFQDSRPLLSYKDAAKSVAIKDNIGTHILRKPRVPHLEKWI